MRNSLVMLVAALSLVACATGGDSRGWSGEGAEPFDAAQAACEASSASLPKDKRPAAFDACMAKAGWHRR